ncbi:MAG: hypothetical protein ACYTG0_18500 [Planctomycetota bacterium]
MVNSEDPAELQQREDALSSEIKRLRDQPVELVSLNQVRLALALTKTQRAILLLRSDERVQKTEEAERLLRETEAVFSNIDPTLFTPEDARVYANAQALARLALLEMLAVLRDRAKKPERSTCRRPRTGCFSRVRPARRREWRCGRR